MRLRRATVADIEGIAELHADSWRRNYRGAFGDAFLDGDVVGERRAAWTERLTRPGPHDHTIVAVADPGVADPGDGDGDGEIVGLAHTIFDRDPELGAMLDNLHVRHGLKGQGLGRRLVVASAGAVVAHDPESGLYVEVLEQNTAAHAFYERLGAHCVYQGTFTPPGGGLTHERRYAWPTPATLLQ